MIDMTPAFSHPIPLQSSTAPAKVATPLVKAAPTTKAALPKAPPAHASAPIPVSLAKKSAKAIDRLSKSLLIDMTPAHSHPILL